MILQQGSESLACLRKFLSLAVKAKTDFSKQLEAGKEEVHLLSLFKFLYAFISIAH